MLVPSPNQHNLAALEVRAALQRDQPSLLRPPDNLPISVYLCMSSAKGIRARLLRRKRPKLLFVSGCKETRKNELALGSGALVPFQTGRLQFIAFRVDALRGGLLR